jgi:hypothetical protein
MIQKSREVERREELEAAATATAGKEGGGRI